MARNRGKQELNVARKRWKQNLNYRKEIGINGAGNREKLLKRVENRGKLGLMG